MSTLQRLRWPVLAALRRSMTAQISVAITLMSSLIVGVSALSNDRFLTAELREENELVLLANLGFLRDDLATAGGGSEELTALVARAEDRVHGLHVAVLDDTRRIVLAKSPHFDLPFASLPTDALSATVLPRQSSIADVERLQVALGAATSEWTSPGGRHLRLLLGRLEAQSGPQAAAAPMLIALAVDAAESSELRQRFRAEVLIGLALAALVAAGSSVLIARNILSATRRQGQAARRISAQALHERLPVDDTPVELRESAVACNQMLDRLQASFERLSVFSSDLAHDLRTPINNLLGEAQVALSRPRSAAEYRAVLESTVEEGERLARMITNMLFLARADNEQIATSAQWLDVDTLLSRVVGYFELTADEAGIRLEWQPHGPDAQSAQVWADESMLVRALSNLIVNALQHSPRGGSVRISFRTHAQGGCVLEVANDGPPIPLAYQGRIFDRFYRVDPSRQGSWAGSGLGLAIVRSIMQLHKGTVSVQSGADGTTVFALYFPQPK